MDKVVGVTGGVAVVTKVGFQAWAVVEIMGHRVRAGLVSEVDMVGGRMLMIERPISDGRVESEFYGLASVFSIVPCTEETANGHWTNRAIGTNGVLNLGPDFAADFVPVGFTEPGDLPF